MSENRIQLMEQLHPLVELKRFHLNWDGKPGVINVFDYTSDDANKEPRVSVHYKPVGKLGRAFNSNSGHIRNYVASELRKHLGTYKLFTVDFKADRRVR